MLICRKAGENPSFDEGGWAGVPCLAWVGSDRSSVARLLVFSHLTWECEEPCCMRERTTRTHTEAGGRAGRD